MRAVAEGLIFREAAAAEFWVLERAGDIAISIYEFDSPSNADRSAFWVYESLDRISWLAFRHGYGLIEIVAKRLRT